MTDFIGTRLNSSNAKHKKIIDFLDQKTKEGSFNKSEFLINALEEKINEIMNPTTKNHTTPLPVAPVSVEESTPAPVPVPVAIPPVTPTTEPDDSVQQNENAGKQIFGMLMSGW